MIIVAEPGPDTLTVIEDDENLILLGVAQPITVILPSP